MLTFRKGKKQIKQYESSFDMAEDMETLRRFFPPASIPSLQDCLRRNAFAFCITGAKLCMGRGLVLDSAGK